MGIFSLLLGCEKSGYYQKDGAWVYDGNPISWAGGYDHDAKGEVTFKQPVNFQPLNATFAKDDHRGFFRGSEIAGSDGPSFEALSEHDAKDRRAVYYADQELKLAYFFEFQLNGRVKVVAQADPASYRLFPRAPFYARDHKNVFYSGDIFPVKDVETFEVLDSGFSKDKVRAYRDQAEIPDSDGATFTLLFYDYAKDKFRVYFTGDSQFSVVKDAHPASFKTQLEYYATDDKRVYHKGVVIADNPGTFQYLSRGYAKTLTRVFYQGVPVPDADTSSFSILAQPSDEVEATDKAGSFNLGKRVE